MGLFICFEGGEGSGKSTQIRSLKRRLNQLNIPNVATREPGGTDFGNRLRKILMFSKDMFFFSFIEYFKFSTDNLPQPSNFSILL